MIEFPRDRISLWKNNKHLLTFIDFFYQIALKKVRLSLTEFWRLQKTTIVYLKTKLKKTYAMGTKNWFKLGRILINLLHILKYFDILLGQFTEYNHFLMVYWGFFAKNLSFLHPSFGNETIHTTITGAFSYMYLLT